jgi:hypothetical protein
MKKGTKKQPASLTRARNMEPAVGHTAQKTLLSIEYPPGFNSQGRKVLAECPEFRIVELYREGGERVFEFAPEVEKALWKSLFRIKGTSSGPWGEGAAFRIEMAIALKKMIRFKNRNYQGGDAILARELTMALCPLVEAALRSENPEGEAEKAGKSFRDAVLALSRDAGIAKRDGRAKMGIPAEAVLIWEAQGAFQHHLVPPKKSYLRKRLERIGYSISGKDAKKRWDDRFERAALSGLPE